MQQKCRRLTRQVTDPNDIIIIEGEQERQADLVFTALTVGEYAFCFRCAGGCSDVTDARSNEHSAFSDKLVGACLELATLSMPMRAFAHAGYLARNFAQLTRSTDFDILVRPT